MDFLLECIGVPPDHPRDALVRAVRERGEPVAWRGRGTSDLRLALGEGLDLRLEEGDARAGPTLWPQYAERRRLRVAVHSLRDVPDSPFDALLTGWAAPPIPELSAPSESPGAYMFSTYLIDARRLRPRPPRGHVLAVSVAGFALDVSAVEPADDDGAAHIEPLGGADAPGGCNELSARIAAVRHVRNPLTGAAVEILEVEAPERPLTLFVSRWQLESDGLDAPRPGWRIAGTFLFSGRIAGGLPRP